MSFTKGSNNAGVKAPWVEVTAPSNNENGSVEDETERLLETCDDEPTAEAIPCVNPEKFESNDEHEEYPQARVVASGTAGCIFGCLMGGVACAIMGGLGSAYAAKHKGGSCVGDTARAMGEVAILAKQKAVALDQKHNVVKTTQEAAKTTFDKAKTLDEQYNITERTKTAVLVSGKATIDFAARHRLVERSIEGVGRGVAYIGRRITSHNSASEALQCTPEAANKKVDTTPSMK